MEKKIEQSYTRQELADFLSELARQLRSGTIEGEGQRKIPQKLDMKFHAKEKKGRIRCKLQWVGSTLEDYDAAGQDEIVKWQMTLKQVKKNLALAFKQLKRTLREGEESDEVLQNFLDASRAFVNFAEPEWQTAAQEYMEHVNNLVLIVRNGRDESIQHELHDIENRMVACHKEFG